jgi:hypothetical protein
MSSFKRIQSRLLKVGVILVAMIAAMRLATLAGVNEPTAYVFGVAAVFAFALIERALRRIWSKGVATAVAAMFVPSALFPINDLFPGTFTDLVLWPAALGLMIGFAYLFWFVFVRPAEPAELEAAE